MIDLAPNSAYGLRLSGPVMTAAGCFGYGVEYARSVPIDRLGAIVTRSVAMRGRAPRPARMLETPSGLLSFSPWTERGLADVLRRYAETWLGWKTPVVLNVEGDYVEVAEALEQVEGIAALELRFDDPSSAATTVAEVRALSLLPLLVKLPLHDALAATARSVAEAGADALTLIAPPRGLAAHPETGESLGGRLSGPAIRPLALQAVADVAASVSIPLIGCGGITSTADARQYLAAGAVAVQVGSVLLADPMAAVHIADELRDAP
jgi:dihydroorotate dehydrogenase (NAD+) catalytic subunit